MPLLTLARMAWSKASSLLTAVLGKRPRDDDSEAPERPQRAPGLGSEGGSRARARREKEARMRSGGMKKKLQGQARKRGISSPPPRASSAHSVSGDGETKRRRMGDVERHFSDSGGGGQTPNVQPAAGNPDATCSFLQMKVSTLTRERHIKSLEACSTATVTKVARKLERMECECDGVHRSPDETEQRVLELKDRDKILLLREYVDRLHGGKSLLTDELERKELRKLALREEDEEEDHWEGQQLFKSPLKG